VDTADLQRVLGAASHQQWLTVRDLTNAPGTWNA
jgi:hypothetical protein